VLFDQLLKNCSFMLSLSSANNIGICVRLGCGRFAKVSSGRRLRVRHIPSDHYGGEAWVLKKRRCSKSYARELRFMKVVEENCLGRHAQSERGRDRIVAVFGATEGLNSPQAEAWDNSGNCNWIRQYATGYRYAGSQQGWAFFQGGTTRNGLRKTWLYSKERNSEQIVHKVIVLKYVISNDCDGANFEHASSNGGEEGAVCCL
jgi:hypothetical protein